MTKHVFFSVYEGLEVIYFFLSSYFSCLLAIQCDWKDPLTPTLSGWMMMMMIHQFMFLDDDDGASFFFWWSCLNGMNTTTYDCVYWWFFFHWMRERERPQKNTNHIHICFRLSFLCFRSVESGSGESITPLTNIYIILHHHLFRMTKKENSDLDDITMVDIHINKYRLKF